MNHERQAGTLRLRGVYGITDRSLARCSHEEQVDRLIRAGVGWIQFREKEMSRRELFRIARRLRERTRTSGVGFIVNDHLDIALAVESEGVHLGQDDLPLEAARRIVPPGFIIGISTHDTDQAVRAAAGGADYIGFGPMFATSTKDAGPPRGIEALREVRAAVRIPIAAIGGIDGSTARALYDAGADMLAVASAIFRADDWAGVVSRLENPGP